jgi:glycosyltransferase involved in cell wall biosynthesis
VLVPSYDPAAFAEAVLKLLNNPGLEKEMGTRGRQKAMRFSWDNVTESIDRFYEEILEGL